MKDRRAERLVSLGGSPAEINSALQKLIKDGFKCSGQCSLINAINVSKNMLTAVGEHSNKEIIFIVGALSTVDPESPENTIQKGKMVFYLIKLILTFSGHGRYQMFNCFIIRRSSPLAQAR